MTCKYMVPRMLLVLLALSATGAASPLSLLDDPPDDEAYQASSQQQSTPVGGIHTVDLASLTLHENPRDFLIELQFHEPSNVRVAYNHLHVHFAHGDQPYRLDFAADTATGAALHRLDPLTLQPSLVGPVEADLSNYLEPTALIPRDLLIDTTGAPPYPGSTLRDFWVEAISRHITVDGEYIQAWDRMPDQGVGETTYDVQQGLRSTGDVRMWSPSPARASNGAATTFVFPAVVANDSGDAAATYELRVADQPEKWDVRLPSQTFRLEAGQQFRFPVLATLPFVHAHGSMETIRLELKELEGEGEAALDLTIVFHAIPQPAGHHPTLYFHSRAGSSATADAIPDPGAFLSMNALAEDPDDEAVPIHGVQHEIGNTTYAWSIPLHPSLQMGLDFDLDSTGSLSFPLAADAPHLEVTLGGTLQYQRGSQTLVLARVGPTQPFDLGPATEPHLVYLEWTPEVDFVPYQGLASLSLELRLESGRPVTFTTPEAPQILPGGSITLPLLEYEDPIDPVFLEDPDVTLSVVGPADKQVNAGRAAVFDLELRALPGASDTYRVQVTGQNAAWSTAPATLDVVPGGQPASFQVVIQPPPDTHDGERIDLVVSAVPDGTGDAALARLRAVVVAGSDIPDEAAAVDPPRGTDASTPAAGVLAPALALTGTAFALRRRD